MAKGKHWWIYAFLFAKKVRNNIDDDELVAFKKLAEICRLNNDEQMAVLVSNEELMEICNDCNEESKV